MVSRGKPRSQRTRLWGTPAPCGHGGSSLQSGTRSSKETYPALHTATSTARTSDVEWSCEWLEKLREADAEGSAERSNALHRYARFAPFYASNEREMKTRLSSEPL